MSTKYTPAPWLVEGTTVYALEHYGWEKREEQFCNRFTALVQRGQKENKDELLANARLIAAAPELLEALQLCANVCAGHTSSKSGLIAALEAAKAAIAKALGVQA